MCTIDQELSYAAAQTPARRFVFTRQPEALFCVKLRDDHRHEICWKYDVTLEIRHRQSMRSCYFKNIPAKFRPDPIWNDGALGFFKRSPQQEEQEQDE